MKTDTLGEVVHLMYEHGRKFDTKPEYMHCSSKGMLPLLNILYQRNPVFDARFNNSELDLINRYIMAEGKDFDDEYLLVDIWHKIDERSYRILGMRVQQGICHQMEFLCGCVPRFLLMSGRVFAPKRAGGHIFECITDLENPLVGNRNWLI